MPISSERGAVLVTGTSTGIGRATAFHLDRLGYQIFATVRSQADAEALCAEASGRIQPILLDVTEPASIARARVAIGRAVGGAGLAGLVNNAGYGYTAPLEFVPLDALRQIFEVNVFGLLAVTQAFLPQLRQARGRIVNVSSIASIGAVPFHGPYSATKSSVNALSNAWRLELLPFGVRVAVVICGSIDTPIWEKGRRLTEQLAARLPGEAMQLYGAAFGRVNDALGAIGRKGVSPEAPARAVAHALTARRPKNTYFVGPDARQLAILQVLLHGRLRDQVTLRWVGLGGQPRPVRPTASL